MRYQALKPYDRKHERYCVCCGGAFMAVWHNARYCSVTCQVTHYKKKQMFQQIAGKVRRT